jgi:hypothetical protein
VCNGFHVGHKGRHTAARVRRYLRTNPDSNTA